MGVYVPNCNLTSPTAPIGDKEKAKPFLPYPDEIKVPGATLNKPPRRGRPPKSR